jgi:hypothetical protein
MMTKETVDEKAIGYMYSRQAYVWISSPHVSNQYGISALNMHSNIWFGTIVQRDDSNTALIGDSIVPLCIDTDQRDTHIQVVV